MSSLGRPCLRWVLGAMLLLVACVGATTEVAPITGTPAQLLKEADDLKTSNHPRFLQLLKQLNEDNDELLLEQQWQLRYLNAYQSAFDGDYSAASAALRVIAEQSPYLPLKLRANGTLINILGFGHRYEDAFMQLDRLAELLPKVSDKDARYYALGETAQFLTIAGQYDLAGEYADQMLQSVPADKTTCKAVYMKLRALFQGGKALVERPQFQQGIDLCAQGGEYLIANAMRTDLATLELQQGRVDDATRLLTEHYAEVEGYHYPALMEYFDVLLAKAYFRTGDLVKAKKYALATIADAVKDEYSLPLSQAYDLLYRMEQQHGDARAALAYHEKFMEADKGYLNDVSAGALAFQTVKQQMLANKMQVDSLNKQNEILQLQRQLDHKAMETGRLYIALLLTGLASIVFWLLRIKRSQLRFKRLATRDGLTGIHSRQHFVEEAEHVLRSTARGSRSACLVLMDLDHFKDVNDTHGHVIGDQVLKRAVAACQHHLRRHDIFGRLGGEEFAVLMPDCHPAQAREHADRIRQSIAATPLWGDTRHVVITASFGVASTDRSGFELRQLMIDADSALYRAKHEGRNRVVGEPADLVVPVNVEPHRDAVADRLAGVSS